MADVMQSTGAPGLAGKTASFEDDLLLAVGHERKDDQLTENLVLLSTKLHLPGLV